MFKILKLSLNKKTVGLLFLNVFLVILTAASDIGAPLVLSQIQGCMEPNEQYRIPNAIIANYSPTISAGIWTVVMITISIFSLIVGLLSVIFLSRLFTTVIYNLRNKMYAKIQTFSLVDLDKIKTSSLLTRLTQDAFVLKQGYLAMFRMLIKSIFLYIGAAVSVVILLTTSKPGGNNVSNPNFPSTPNWSIIALVATATIFLILTIMMAAAPAIKYFLLSKKNTDDINNLVQENVVAQRLIKSFNLQEQQLKTFDFVSNELRKSLEGGSLRIFIATPTIYFLLNIIMPIVIWLHPSGFVDSKFATISILLSILITSIILIVISMVQIVRAIPSVKRIRQIFDYDPIIKYPNVPAPLNDDAENSIEINNMSFKYNPDNDYILKDINIKIKPNEVVGIIGSTSSGKTTLLNLILRMYDVTEGEIKLCGTNIKDFTKEQLKSLITYSPQFVTLFQGTIKSNLLFAKPDATEEEIIESTKIANAYEFIMKKEKQFDDEVVERGNNFSGGQKQRLAIARTLLKKSKFLILDDSTSALDMITEKEIQKKLLENNYNQTMLLVAQRISAVKNANRIIVMQDGKILGFDTHINLLRNCQEYYDIAVSQLGEREVLRELENAN